MEERVGYDMDGQVRYKYLRMIRQLQRIMEMEK